MQNFKIGNWVSFHSNISGRKLLGYIVAEEKKENIVKIYVPTEKRVCHKSISLLTCEEETNLLDTNLETLVDLALDTKDYQWLQRIKVLENKH